MNKMVKNTGQVYIYTGEGKGKTSAALGTALRMLLLDKTVVWISWYKSVEWPISEKKFEDKFRKKLTMYWMGKGFYIKKGKEVHLGNKISKKAKVGSTYVFDKSQPNEHKVAAGEALALAREFLDDDLPTKPNLLILDEVINAINDDLVKTEDIVKVIKHRGSTNIVLTGRNCPQILIDMADLVTDMRKVKHPFDIGNLAISGLDY